MANSILHLILRMKVGRFSREPIMRLLIEGCKMDVNVENICRETPLHWLSSDVSLLPRRQPTEEMMNIAELLIDNGAHMDSVDICGKEASSTLSQKFPKWSFNVNLKCLAARAILKHGVKYKKVVADTEVDFIESHKPGRL